MPVKIFHNPRCRKSRAGLAYLESKTSGFEVVDYMRNRISKDEIKEILLKIHLEPFQLIRTNEEIYRKQFKGKNFTGEEWIEILAEYPQLLKRPIVVAKYKAVLADPPEKVDLIIN
jgi:arsenate reductase (glutaredoxin)